MNEQQIEVAKLALGDYTFSPEATEFILSLIGKAYDEGFKDGATAAVTDHWDEEDLLLIISDDDIANADDEE